MGHSSERRLDLDRGKDLAILLVVFGHLVARADPTGLSWYEPIRALIYAFHIPFLFYLSGYAAQLSGGADATGAAYARLLRRRAHRLLLPAALFGLIILIGKYLAQPIMHVDHAPASLLGGLSDLVWHTDRSPAQSVWYLIVLFVFAIVTPPLLTLWRGRVCLLVALGLLLFWLPVPALVYGDRIAANALFFAIGLFAGRQDTDWCVWIDRHRRSLVVLFLCSLLLVFLLNTELAPKSRMLLVSAVALPALHAAMRHPPRHVARLLDWMTPYALAIYLLNTVFIGLAKGLLMTSLPWNAPWFPLYAVVLMAAGIGGPTAMTLLIRAPLMLYARKYAA
ncbi:acyltransferase family protein [Acidisoma cladoniae]|jgi:fucose 4-O-acetylase-like acetyltransferase|uniref:acyltransferase family protein n=1 Tax=Acidisoma cladoniae TaxID=3040935 RepID=UPI00254B64F7|nr:acyltransferase family protein [Acidisoma sp. PAMC 29798]